MHDNLEAPSYTTIVTTRAGDPLIGEALASIQGQTLAAARVLVVCDAHEDVPVAWAAELARACPQTELIRNPSRGHVSALNCGITHVTTPYVAFLDSDDVWLPDKQRLQVELLSNTSELDAACCMAANVHDDSSGARQVEPPVPSTMFTSTTFRRDTFDRFGRPDPEATHFAWIYRWWGEAKRAGITTRCVDYVGLYRRLHGGNSWAVDSGKAHQDLFGELRRHINRGQS